LIITEYNELCGIVDCCNICRVEEEIVDSTTLSDTQMLKDNLLRFVNRLLRHDYISEDGIRIDRVKEAEELSSLVSCEFAEKSRMMELMC
jgi:hypothetical protein